MARRDQKQEIMQAAEKLFANRRFHEVTLDEVAQLAKVGKGTIYRHFRDKDDLFFQAATSGFEELCELLNKKIPDSARFQDRLLATCQEITNFFYRRRQLFRLMQMEEGRVLWEGGTLWEHWLEKRQALVETLIRLLDQGAAEGAVRRDVKSDVLAVMLLGLLRTGARYLVHAGQSESQLELIISVFLHGAAGPRSDPDHELGS